MALPNDYDNDIFAANGFVRGELLEPTSAKALQRSVCWASDTRWESIRTPHLFMGLLSTADRQVNEWCRMIGADPDSLLLQFAALFSRPRDRKAPPVRLNREFLSENAIRVLRDAWERSQIEDRELISISDLLVTLFSPAGGIVAGCFADVGFAPDRLAAMAVATEAKNPRPRGR